MRRLCWSAERYFPLPVEYLPSIRINEFAASVWGSLEAAWEASVALPMTRGKPASGEIDNISNPGSLT